MNHVWEIDFVSLNRGAQDEQWVKDIPENWFSNYLAVKRSSHHEHPNLHGDWWDVGEKHAHVICSHRTGICGGFLHIRWCFNWMNPLWRKILFHIWWRPPSPSSPVSVWACACVSMVSCVACSLDCTLEGNLRWRMFGLPFTPGQEKLLNMCKQ